MNKFYSLLSITMLSLGITAPSWAGNDCMPIAQACMKEGFYKGGHESGKGLIEDCVMPVVKKDKTLPEATFTDDVLQKCEATIQEKMKEGESKPQ